MPKSSRTDGVSVVLPVKNGAPWLAGVLEALLREDPGGSFEIIVIDDGSTDGSPGILARFTRDPRIRVLDGPRRGAAAALNVGLLHAQGALIAQVDQDVLVQPGWLAALCAELANPSVGAAQGYYVTDPDAPLSARVMGLDLEQRYSTIKHETDHVCTGNSLYRAEALAAIGGFDESLGYGYDNDVSYRLRAAGFRLVLCRGAQSVHHWRQGFRAYLAQQYGFGYGRLDLVSRHRRHVTGDQVSPLLMMLHPALLCAGVALAVLWLLRANPRAGLGMLLLTVGLLAAERAIAGWRAWRRYNDWAGLAFPVFHLARDMAWVVAIVLWAGRRLLHVAPQPGDSMRPRPAVTR